MVFQFNEMNMNIKFILQLLFLFLLFTGFTGCQEVEFPEDCLPEHKEEDVILQGKYNGIAHVRKITFRSNVGPGNIYEDTSFSFEVNIELAAAVLEYATYETTVWDRCSELPINVIGSPCPGNHISFSDSHSFCASYEHDQLNALCIWGLPEVDSLYATYEYKQIFEDEIFDNDGNLLYAEWDSYLYDFAGKR